MDVDVKVSGGVVRGGTPQPVQAWDWLTVNVWSPDLSGALPVMVWI